MLAAQQHLHSLRRGCPGCHASKIQTSPVRSMNRLSRMSLHICAHRRSSHLSFRAHPPCCVPNITLLTNHAPPDTLPSVYLHLSCASTTLCCSILPCLWHVDTHKSVFHLFSSCLVANVPRLHLPIFRWPSSALACRPHHLQCNSAPFHLTLAVRHRQLLHCGDSAGQGYGKSAGAGGKFMGLPCQTFVSKTDHCAVFYKLGGHAVAHQAPTCLQQLNPLN